MTGWPPPKHVRIYLDCTSMCIVLDQLVDKTFIDMHRTNNIVKFDRGPLLLED
jgi:hypothetical protein